MTALPKIVRHDGVDLAYQVTGQGPPLLFVNGWFTDIVAQWSSPRLTAFLQHLGSFASLISVDKRGVGRSSRVPADALPSIDTKVADLVAVVDQLGFERVSVLGTSESGPLAAAFAAAHPDRLDRLILDAARARYGPPTDGYPFGYGADELEPYVRGYEEGWGTRGFAEGFLSWVAPSLAADPVEVDAYVDLMRASGESATVGAATRSVYATTDVRDRLAAIGCPTLVLAHLEDQVVSVDEVQWLADHIPGAGFEVIVAGDHPCWGDAADSIAGHVGSFSR